MLPDAKWFFLPSVLFGLLLPACQQDSQYVLKFDGVCDASAAVRVGRDRLLVAYDEATSVYEFNADGGAVVHTYPLHDLLNLSRDNELDLEAAVLHDQGIWWIGSHGRDSDAAPAPSRELLFKTDIPAKNSNLLTLKDGPYNLGKVLNEALSEITDESAFKSAAPKEGGINIEGITVTPEGDFLIGLRSPLSSVNGGDALIVKLALSNGEFELAGSYQLALDNRGIRDLALTDDGYLLIAGALANGGLFSIFEWDVSGALTKLLDLPEGFNAEALVDMGDYWLVLSDDGKVDRPRSDKKDATCDKIFRKLPDNSESVFFRGLIMSAG